MAPIFCPCQQRWRRDSWVILRLYYATPTSLKLITFSHPNEVAKSCTALEWMIFECQVSVYKLDLSHMGVSWHRTGAWTVEKYCVYKRESLFIKLEFCTGCAIVRICTVQNPYLVSCATWALQSQWPIGLKCPTQHNHTCVYILYNHINWNSNKSYIKNRCRLFLIYIHVREMSYKSQ